MWKLRMITGPKAGETFSIEQGENLVGRSPTSHIVIPAAGVSKSHCKIQLKGNALRISDLKSSNGTYVNGLKVDNSILQVGDKISFHDVIAELEYIVPQFQSQQSENFGAYNGSGNAAEDLLFQDEPAPYSQEASPEGVDRPETEAPPRSLQESIHHYIENIMLPGVYKLAVLFDFKMVLMSFVLTFIVLVTALSVLPMLQITQDSIEKESSRRALSIARSLVSVNQAAIGSGFQSQLNTRFAEKEEGVKVALIISATDGSVLAPANQIGSYKNEAFIHSARKIDEELTSYLENGIIGASVPIRSYDPNTGNYDIRAFAVVLYNMGSLAIDDGRTLSLFIQTLLLALAIGSLLFFFLYKLIERPFRHLSSSLDKAIAGDLSAIEPEFKFTALTNLYTNINSLINQNLSGSSHGDGGAYEDPSDAYTQAENMVRILPIPALALDASGLILACNPEAESLLHESAAQLIQQHFQNINDESLKLSLQDLVERATQDPHLIHSNELEFAGVNQEIDIQAFSRSGKALSFFVCIKEKMGGFQ